MPQTLPHGGARADSSRLQSMSWGLRRATQFYRDRDPRFRVSVGRVIRRDGRGLVAYFNEETEPWQIPTWKSRHGAISCM